MAALPFRLLLVTNRKLVPGGDLVSSVEMALEAGVRAVQLREKDLSARELYDLGLRLRQLTFEYHTKLLVNERFDIARAVHADGVHLSSAGLPTAVVRRRAPELLVGVSTHSAEEALAAEEQGADYILFGPVFPTPEKLKYGAPQGLNKLHEVARLVHIPVFAVGGITPERARNCTEHGAAGVAVISAILQTREIKKTVLEFKRQMHKL